MEKQPIGLDRFLQEINVNLNSQQRKAAARIRGATLLLAVPGSGKTTVMICRLGYMIKVLKIPPDQILAMTFSKAGAQDLDQRYQRIMGSGEISPQFSTIHSFAYRILRIYCRQAKKKLYGVLDDPTSLLRKLYLQLFKAYPADTEIDEIKNHIGMVKNLMLSMEEIRRMNFDDVDLPKIYRAYEQYKRQNQLMDYEDMLVYALGLLKREKALFDFFVRRYQYVCLDEAQDTSKLQFALIDCIAKASGNFFVVGDEDQSIYGFRGAYPEALLNFKQNWPEGEILFMETNYRSTGKLVAAADRFIRINPDRFEKKMCTPNPPGVPAFREVVAKREDQYTFILNCVRREGKETAVLYRNNESAIPLVDLLESSGVPYGLKEHQPVFFNHFILKDLRAFYALAADPTNLETFKAVYFKMNAYVTRDHISYLEEYRGPKRPCFEILAGIRSLPEWQKDRLLDLQEILDQLNRFPINRGLGLILEDLGYWDHLTYRMDRGYPKEKIQQKLAILKTMTKRYPNKDDFWQRLAELEMIMAGQAGRKEAQKTGAHLTLSTIHSAKGLEWEKVFVIDCIDGEFPSHSALAATAEGKRLLAEEIRLFYVGVTRAKKELEFLIVGNGKKGSKALPVSRFVQSYFEEYTALRAENTGEKNEKTGKRTH